LIVTRTTWKWPLWRALPLLVFFLAFDIPFFAANALKFFHGGYVPIVIGAVFFTVMVVWRRGRRMLRDALAERTKPVAEFIAEYGEGTGRIQCRMEGTGVVMSSHAEGGPAVFVHPVDRL
jgi:KUP system potassium uptake protein